MNPILEALGDAGYLLDTPGAYLRGALAGRFGERASGDELLGSYGFDGGPLGGAATEFLLDPLGMPGLALGAFKGLRGLNRFAASHTDDANPLLRGLAGLGDEGGWVPIGRAREMLDSGEGPLGRMGRMAESASPARVDVDPEGLARSFDYPGAAGDPYAIYEPGREARPSWDPYPGEASPPRILPNLNHDAWASDPLMWETVRRMNSRPPTIGPGGLHDYVGVHEVGHAAHAADLDRWAKRPGNLVGARIEDLLPPEAGVYHRYEGGRWAIPDPLSRDVGLSLGPYATEDPHEFVAEGFAREVLGKPMPRSLRDLYDALLGPDPAALPPGFWDALGRRR